MVCPQSRMDRGQNSQLPRHFDHVTRARFPEDALDLVPHRGQD